MNNLIQIIQSNVKEINLPSNFINKLYQSVVRQNNMGDVYAENSNMIGRIDVNATYQEYIDTINELFPLLEITPAGVYVYFEDAEVRRILTEKIGDGTGVTEQAILNVRSWDGFWFRPNNQSNNNIIKFNEFYKFTNVTSIPQNAFLLLEGLQEINMNNILTVGISALDRCYALTTVEADNVTNVGNQGFRQCTSLENINISKVETIGDNAFMDCPLSNANFGNSITTIGYRGFSRSGIVNIDLSNLTIIGNEAFGGCSSLTNINSDLSNVTAFGSGVFYNCKNLKGDFVLTNITSVPVTLFYGCENITSVDVSNATTWASYAWGGPFSGCKKLHTVIINPNVKTIGPKCFENCSSLINIDTSHIETYEIVNNQCNHFAGCSSLKQITLNENVTIIPNIFALNCVSLKEITIPANVTYIGAYAFKGCTSLEKVTILATTPPELAGVDAFNWPNTYPIYVPAGSVEAYKAADKWNTYASNRIQAIPTT